MPKTKEYFIALRGRARMIASTSVEATSEKEALEEAKNDPDIDWHVDPDYAVDDVEVEVM